MASQSASPESFNFESVVRGHQRVILLTAYSFPAILSIASYGKTRNSQSKESRNQNPAYGIG